MKAKLKKVAAYGIGGILFACLIPLAGILSASVWIVMILLAPLVVAVTFLMRAIGKLSDYVEELDRNKPIKAYLFQSGRKYQLVP